MKLQGVIKTVARCAQLFIKEKRKYANRTVNYNRRPTRKNYTNIVEATINGKYEQVKFSTIKNYTRITYVDISSLPAKH